MLTRREQRRRCNSASRTKRLRRSTIWTRSSWQGCQAHSSGSSSPPSTTTQCLPKWLPRRRSTIRTWLHPCSRPPCPATRWSPRSRGSRCRSPRGDPRSTRASSRWESRTRATSALAAVSFRSQGRFGRIRSSRSTAARRGSAARASAGLMRPTSPWRSAFHAVIRQPSRKPCSTLRRSSRRCIPTTRRSASRKGVRCRSSR
mmetsp:Transcript_46727/g.138027  ORF Transcript_46727/g.138027 Transcript_46727/m.138027 type:complete len:202 (-) Transcript_46727:371-976(-)